MAITLDQADIEGANASGTATSIAYNTTATVAAAADIFQLIKARASVTITSFTGGGLTWTEEAVASSGVDVLYLYKARAPSGLASGATITANLSATSTNRIIEGCSFTGLADAAKEDSGGNFLSSSSGWTSETMDASSAESLTITAVTLDTDVGHTPTAPSLEAFDGGATFDYRRAMVYRIDTSVGSYTNAGTFAFSAFIVHATAVYGAAGGAGANSFLPARRRGR